MLRSSYFYYQEYLPPIKNYDAWYEYLSLMYNNMSKAEIVGIKEQHHIVPKCYLPKDMTLEESFIDNKVILSTQDHYLAHYWLAKAIGGKMISAFKRMSYNYKYKSAKFPYGEDPEEILQIKVWYPGINKKTRF